MAQGNRGISLTINVVGIKELTIKLARLNLAMQDYTDPLKRAEKYISQKTAQAFRYGGAETQWKPLSPITIKKKGSSAVLIDTGRLRSNAVGHDVHFRTASTMMLTVNNEYGAFHQFGIGVPQRKFFVVLPQEERQIALFVRAYIDKQVRR